jgi:hypothetical protein
MGLDQPKKKLVPLCVVLTKKEVSRAVGARGLLWVSTRGHVEGVHVYGNVVNS